LTYVRVRSVRNAHFGASLVRQGQLIRFPFSSVPALLAAFQASAWCTRPRFATDALDLLPSPSPRHAGQRVISEARPGPLGGCRLVSNMVDYNTLAVFGPTPDSWLVAYGRRFAGSNMPPALMNHLASQPEMIPMRLAWIRYAKSSLSAMRIGPGDMYGLQIASQRCRLDRKERDL
jgi:hypothetical protein